MDTGKLSAHVLVMVFFKGNLKLTVYKGKLRKPPDKVEQWMVDDTNYGTTDRVPEYLGINGKLTNARKTTIYEGTTTN